jgi:glucose-6-phosphate dehydrogenase assembly protein OpcA
MSLTAQIPAEAAAIERALQELWRGEAAQDQGSALVCARTVNLVVWCACAGEADAVNRDVEAVTALHPGRVIVIDGARGAGWQARVSASCLTSHAGDRYLGRETIMLCGDQVPAQQLTSLVNSLLLPDLPVFLWWRDVPRADSPLFAALVPRASRVVVDSASGDLPASLQAVL